MALTGGLLTVTLGVLDGRILAIPQGFRRSGKEFWKRWVFFEIPFIKEKSNCVSFCFQVNGYFTANFRNSKSVIFVAQLWGLRFAVVPSSC